MITKPCPKCGGKLVALTKYLVCGETEPRCKHKEPLPEDIRLRREGWPCLPGME